MKPLLLTQRIIAPEKVWEFPVFFEPQVWYKGPCPTSVIVEGEIPHLEKLVEYARLHGWDWDATMRRFYPVHPDE
jgi:hypothetical protein